MNYLVLLFEDFGNHISKKVKDIGYYLQNRNLEGDIIDVLGIQEKKEGKLKTYVLKPKNNIYMIGELFMKYIKRKIFCLIFLDEVYTFSELENINKFILKSGPYIQNIASQLETVIK